MDVQARLGHENIDTTVGVYGHLAPDAHGRMSDTIANVLQGVRPMRQIEDADMPELETMEPLEFSVSSREG